MLPAQIAGFRAALHGASSAIVLFDDDRRILDVNAAACHLLARSRAGLLTVSLDELTAPGRRVEMLGRWDVFRDSGLTAGRTAMVLGNGTRREFSFFAARGVGPGVHLKVLHPLPVAADGTRPPITPRERDVLEMVALGCDTQEIADHLLIGSETVRTHVRQAVRKLGARNRTHAVTIALERGLLAITAAPPAPLADPR